MPRRPPAPAVMAALAALAAFVVGACSAGTPGAGDPGGQDPGDLDPGVVHVHGLGLDPADPATVYAATHTGLFRLSGEGPAERVTDDYHDLMGFTVTGDGRFLASGHPDLRVDALRRPDAPPLLGLVESPDAGRSWEPRSLLGEADFHALEAAHGRVYGADSTSGRLMVSDDGRRWETRSTPGLTDVAVNPADPDVLVGTGGAGAVRSGDGGRTWRPLEVEPPVVLAWDDDGLWAATPGGAVLNSADDGDTWRRRGNVGGAPEALLAAGGGRLVAAVDAVGIVESGDGGETWRVRHPTGPAS